MVYESPGNVFDIQCNKSISVLRLPGSDVCPCTGMIPKTVVLGYKDLHARKMEAGCSRSSKKYSMTDSIQNIQERTAGAMSVASAPSAGVCLVATSERSNSKHGVLV